MVFMWKIFGLLQVIDYLLWSIRLYVCMMQASGIGLARTVCIHTVYDRVFGDFPARKSVYTLDIYGSGHS